ncbi:hypothetical protein SAMN02745163_02959 [Clostridium cavendishii DSM 21758]|uniref:Uncharacterized protein n=1 Tax=Clostridium cavendishii DSM 21758 TaxID=1121302 RepID=A0A1M6NN60_9CLOT|nr:hypothetical protein [Clostridium cavendishii]SHJ97179.1 hypothetical protein SAMN02745163_02959 [Clostridium cavendishii DSM 21758]
MDDKNFIRYIGDYRVHDSSIETILQNEDIIQVYLISNENEKIIVTFIDVKSMKSNRPEGMILYSISEMKEQPPFRKFIFVNWDEDNDASLEIIAKDCIFNN